MYVKFDGRQIERVPSLPTRNGNGPQLWAMIKFSMVFPAYLQGMETRIPGSPVAVLLGCSQPTYKEWKRPRSRSVGAHSRGSQPTYKEWKQIRRAVCHSLTSMFPAYLQGMETVVAKCYLSKRAMFPAYLQGMETKGTGGGTYARCQGFPAYLQGMETYIPPSCGRRDFKVPSLPTRNGNGVEWYTLNPFSLGSQPNYKEWKQFGVPGAAFPPLRSQPTYKEWKPFTPAYGETSDTLFPAYLQGMETG